ncbi:cation-transporting P-type ATPase [Mangrovivirga sp. M17]|uniref:Cation-transporting P-type ATPase n=1 Tax=Mangrovivirga halotolerans TaxID=2993936 RepID=A0ABT3RUJ9_9BACT|nr:cation-transporting P-type ATPase [Mangrovivirga halotolerans]MCX2745457.1 cation-transporting P-type ATPase [Mangrovivirga halotolerans]
MIKKYTTNISGLSPDQVAEQRSLNGANESIEKEGILQKIIFSIITEPMLILLLAACTIYFIFGELSEAFTMLAAIFFVTGIDIFQNFKSQKAVKALSKLTSSKAKVLREDEVVILPTREIVTRDIIICEEGTIIPADAKVISSYDFSVNEAIMTGESASINKQSGEMLIQGTMVVGGYCYARVTAVGKKTTLAGIGYLVKETSQTKSPLQEKVHHFVKRMVIIGAIAFLFVWGYHTWESGSLLHGLLHGLTMAMSVLPEELQVALSTFMALGAYRLLKVGIIAKSPRTVETLGSATVICLDKTGTLTQNLMKVTHVFDFQTNREINYDNQNQASEVLEYAMWASEESPFDPMEKSIHEIFDKNNTNDLRTEYKIIKEFPLSGKPPVMTHIFGNQKGDRILACKGALESIVRICNLNASDANIALAKGQEYAKKGYRVLGVAKGHWDKEQLPENQEEITFQFLGLITFHDPPDKHIPELIKNFYQAGVRVVMITGDYPETAMAIAQKTGINHSHIISGDEIQQMNKNELKQAVSTCDIFARISPGQKLKIIAAIKSNGDTVAMTGDGVNDAPALKAAHIGISMGKRGTEVAKEAADLVLTNDNLDKMMDAIFLGRRINENLKKAFRYIISIHIPIILLVTLPIFLTWLPVMLFTPIHVIFLELIMGPTCSIIYENEPIQQKNLITPLKNSGNSLLQRTELWITILQGIIITLGCLATGYWAKTTGESDEGIRVTVFGTLIISNIFLTLGNRSFTENIFKTIKLKNHLIPIIIGTSVLFMIAINYIPFLNEIFIINPLSFHELIVIIMVSLTSTLWIEFFKKDSLQTY